MKCLAITKSTGDKKIEDSCLRIVNKPARAQSDKLNMLTRVRGGNELYHNGNSGAMVIPLPIITRL